MNFVTDRSGRSDTYQVLHIIKVKKLIGVNADGRHSHAGPHDGYALSLIKTRKSERSADTGHLLCILKKCLCDKLRSERISRQKHCIRKITVFRINVWCRNLIFTHSYSLSPVP